METLARITESRLVPLLSPKKPEMVLPLLAALCSGGLSCAEFSMSVPFTPDALRNGSRLFPDLILGAGGITTLSEAQTAVHSGARYLTTVGFSSSIAELCQGQGVLYIPQCTTPSELLAVAQSGLSAAGLFAPHLWASDEILHELINAFPKITLLACRVPCSAANRFLAFSHMGACTLTGLSSDSPEALADSCRKLCEE